MSFSGTGKVLENSIVIKLNFFLQGPRKLLENTDDFQILLEKSWNCMEMNK